MTRPSEFRNGVFHLDGEARPFLAADYPYFRDDADNWPDRVRAAREAGFDVLSFYVPWRHHAPEDPLRGGAYDFFGATQPNRDVARLLDLAAAEGLRVLLKPGPFVHAELPYGGLPEYVAPERNPSVEAELDAEGIPVRWAIGGMREKDRHALPAPFGHTYLAYVRHWLGAVAADLLADRTWPRGPVVAVQLMNEGIYSDSSNADPLQMGYAVSTLDRFHAFLEERYRTLESYNALHGARHGSWHEIDPPRAVAPLAAPRDLLRYLDWSEFQSRLYSDCAMLYRSFLIERGLDEKLPCLLNFNPNGSTFRTRPASNDGWYTRVNLRGAGVLTFGTTNWVGVVSGDEAAYRQYVMATSAWRGPALEQNWGFSTQYDAPYAHVTPSHFESMLGMACGATGVTAYTVAGTRAWRSDPNLAGDWVTHRTADREDVTSGDYPGSAPILSDGRRADKYWTLLQLGQWLGAEGPRFIAAGPASRVGWAIYPPYAWAGQWLPRGDPDDLRWRPPLKAVPRGAYHGLDAFVEMMLDRGLGFRQVDVGADGDGLGDVDALCISAHEYMDLAAQERLAAWVERGGRLLLTNLVPDKDEHLRETTGALATRVFPHRVTGRRALESPVSVHVEGQPAGLALEFAHLVEPPDDADLPVTLEDDAVIGYRRRVGRGEAVYLGIGPWRARWSGDDARAARANQALTFRLLEIISGEAFGARPLTRPGEVAVWEHGRGPAAAGEHGRAAAERHLFVVVREADGEIEVDLGDGLRLLVVSPSQAIHAIALESGRPRAVYLKGVNDARGERVPPWAQAGGVAVGAQDPCDLCVTREPDGGARVTVAHLARGSTRVRLPFPASQIRRVASATGDVVEATPDGDAAWIEVRDVAEVGAYRVLLEATARPPTRLLS